VDPSCRTPPLVHAVDGKRVFRADGPEDRLVDDAAMREIGEERGRPKFGELSCFASDPSFAGFTY
jgi:hypothetical protein